MTANNSINNTLQSPFNIGAISVTSTGTQLNYLNGLSAVPINKIHINGSLVTGSFTYTPTTGTQYAIFELLGGGGGSGGTTGASLQAAAAGAGAAGGYLKILVSGASNLNNISGNIGAGGSAGLSGNNNGGTGENTTLVINGGTTWIGAGGGGGNGQTANGSEQAAGMSGSTVSNTIGTNAQLIISINGEPGSFGYSNGPSPAVFPAYGGSSPLGNGGVSNAIAAGTGAGFGGGAGGGCNLTGSNSSGTVGGQGIILVTEFISA